MNLCINARDAMPDGGTLTIALEKAVLSEEYFGLHRWLRQEDIAAKMGDYVVLSVTDTGIGMDEETQRHIFEPFFTTKEPGQGTGLGLAMVQGIVKQHGGFVHCYSELGKGTTFRIYLPYKKVEAGKIEAEEKKTLRGEGVVLLAEDEEFLREVISKSLEIAGFTVVACKDGEEAVEKFKQAPDSFYAVVVDAVMPKVSGPEAIRRMRAIRPDVRTVLTTGYTKESLAPNELGEGVVLVEKPFGPRELLDALLREKGGDST